MVQINVSVGELIDKLSILSIKLEKVQDEKKIQHAKKEHSFLSSLASKYLVDKEVNLLYNKLILVNSELWEIEDKIRKYELEKNFNQQFIDLARKVYITNDERFNIKDKINQITYSEIVEIKDYVDYQSK